MTSRVAGAELNAASSMVQELICARRLLKKLGFPQSDPNPLLEDSTTCIKRAGGAVRGTDRGRHIDLREHFVHEAQNNKALQLVDSADNVANLLETPRNSENLRDHRRDVAKLGLQAAAQGCFPAIEEEQHGRLNVTIAQPLQQSRLVSWEACCKVTAEAPRLEVCRVHVLIRHRAGLSHGPPLTRMKRH